MSLTDLEIIKQGSDPTLFSPIMGHNKSGHIWQLNGRQPRIPSSAEHMIINEDWGISASLPNLIYMSEIDRMLLSYYTISEKCIYYPAMSYSDDHGETWSEPRIFRTDGIDEPDSGYALKGLTYLGEGKILTGCEPSVMGNNRTDIFKSFDYGNTWTKVSASEKAPDGFFWWKWDPYFVDTDKTTGKVVRLIDIGFCMHEDSIEGNYCQPWIRYSYDEGKTWTKAEMIAEWRGWNENTVCRALNGDLIAALRSDGDPDMMYDIDWNSGLGISISKDNGLSWSKPSLLYKKGRMHPSFVVMPDGTIVMTYVCRKGYGTTPEGFWMYGIEAVESYDNGATWDFEHRYILASWKGCHRGLFGWICGPQATSSIKLKDDTILTAYGICIRTQYGMGEKFNIYPRDTGIVRWKLNRDNVKMDNDLTLKNHADSLLERNYLDPLPLIIDIPYINIEQPEEKRIFQRNRENFSTVPVEGSYYGDIDAIEWRYGKVLKDINKSKTEHDNGFRSSEWELLDCLFENSRFIGKVKIPSGGWYRLELRGIKKGSQVMWAAVYEFGVGEVFVAAGGSNAANLGAVRLKQENNRVVSLGWNGWSRAQDPMKAADGTGGSPWPEAGRILEEKLGVPIGFSCIGTGDCEVSQWLRWVYSDDRDLFYKLKRVLDYLGKDGCRAVLWHQGEKDSALGISRKVYSETLRCVISQTREDAGWDVPWMIALAGGDMLREAQESVCGRDEVYKGPLTDDLCGSEWRADNSSVFFNEKGLLEHGRRWAETVVRTFNF